MNAVDVRGVIRAVVAELRADGNTGHVESLLDADAALAELIDTQQGCRDMLREAAKHFRALGETGHANMCELHASVADAALARVGGAR